MRVDVFEFKAVFTTGLMKNLIMEQTMTFPSEENALDWAVRVNNNNRSGHCEFWVMDMKRIGEKFLGESA